MRCDGCRYFYVTAKAGEYLDGFTSAKREEDWGLCRRVAPVALQPNDRFDAWFGAWPGVKASDWCGQYEAQ